MEIKHPRKGDVLPVPLELMTFDPEWVWIYGNSILFAVAGHDLVILLRVIRFGEMPTMWLHRLFRHVFQECKERGYQRWMVFLANNLEEEKKLLEIAHRYYGAHFDPFQGDLAMGVL